MCSSDFTFGGKIVDPADIDHYTWEAEMAQDRVPGFDDERMPFTTEELSAMADDPCAFGYHRFEPTAEEWADEEFREYHEGLTCLNGCGFGIG